MGGDYRHLLVLQEEGRERSYSQHAILQAFYYDLASPRHRRQLHQHAAEFYVHEEPDPLRAAIHYERAGDYARAVEASTRDVWSLINQGQARTVAGILMRVQPNQVDPGIM